MKCWPWMAETMPGKKMIAAHRASNNSLGVTKMTVNAQATVTGWGFTLIGVALAIPTGGASLAFSAVGAGLATAGICSL